MSTTSFDRTAEHAKARQMVDAARSAYAQATTKRAKRDAAEDLEFWSSRSAMLAVRGGWAS